MSDLRTAVDALLPCTAYANGRCLDVDGVTPSWRPCNACAVLDLIPKGSVLVTEETLAAALISDFGPRIRHEKAVAILARIREAPP